MSEEVKFNTRTGANVHKANKAQLRRFSTRNSIRVTSTGTRGKPTKEDYVNAIVAHRKKNKKTSPAKRRA